MESDIDAIVKKYLYFTSEGKLYVKTRALFRFWSLTWAQSSLSGCNEAHQSSALYEPGCVLTNLSF